MRQTEFVDLAPAEFYATRLDQGIYRCSIRSMYRILYENHEVCERRQQLRHPVYKKPELLAEGPNQVWSWVITKLMGPAKWTCFYLYVIIDIFSRRIVGWQVADAESASLFKPLFEDAAAKHGIVPGELALHADRSPSMKAKVTVLLLADLGVTKLHSRPYTSNDNPFCRAYQGQRRTIRTGRWARRPRDIKYCVPCQETGCYDPLSTGSPTRLPLTKNLDAVG